VRVYEENNATPGYQVGTSDVLYLRFQYDALGRRVLKEDLTGSKPFKTWYTHDGQKVVGEHRAQGFWPIGEGEIAYLTPSLARYYVDGSTYIDEHAVVRQFTGASAGEYYYLLKELYSVAGLVQANGGLVEAYTYDAYGKVRVYTTQAAPCIGFGDVDGDCDVDIADFEALSLCFSTNGVPGDCPPGALERLDFNTNGTVDDADLEAFADVVTGPRFGLFADGDWNSNGSVGPVDHNKFVNVCYSGPGGGFNTNGCQVFDFDGDSDVDLDDYGVLLALWYETSPNAPVTLTAADASAVNDYYFTGRSLDYVPHGGERHQRYYYRARTYNTERFMQRDPQIEASDTNSIFESMQDNVSLIPFLSERTADETKEHFGVPIQNDQYSDGANLYTFVQARPSVLVDPNGTRSCNIRFCRRWASTGSKSKDKKSEKKGKAKCKKGLDILGHSWIEWDYGGRTTLEFPIGAGTGKNSATTCVSAYVNEDAMARPIGKPSMRCMCMSCDKIRECLTGHMEAYRNKLWKPWGPNCVSAIVKAKDNCCLGIPDIPPVM